MALPKSNTSFVARQTEKTIRERRQEFEEHKISEKLQSVPKSKSNFYIFCLNKPLFFNIVDGGSIDRAKVVSERMKTIFMKTLKIIPEKI